VTFLGELRVGATLENLHVLTDFVQSIGRRLQLSQETLFHLDLAVEEAAANVVEHAYPPGQYGDVRLRAEKVKDAIRITLTDWGIPYDPDTVQPFDTQAPIETRMNGGMGLHFIHSLMDTVMRETVSTPGGPNTLTLIKRFEPSPADETQVGADRLHTLRELDAMLTVSRSIAADVDLDDLLVLIINELVQAIDAERGAVYLLDEGNRVLYSRVLSTDSGGLQEIRLPVGQGLAGHVAASGKVLNIQDAYEDARFDRAFDRLTGFRTRTILTVPMRNPQGDIVGVVQVVNKKDGPFTERDEQLLAAIANQAAISIENARLYAQAIRQKLVSQELATARMIQESFLPQIIPQHAGWDIAAHWRPMREVAGDFYDFYPLSDGRLAIVIADVSGKGVPAALFMALSVTVLRFAMSLNFSPGELMHRANAAIIADQGSRMFTTAFVGYLDLDSGVLRFASAGHNPPLVYRTAESHCQYLVASGVAMGLFESARYTEGTLTLEDQDVLVLYTDGITEVIDAQEREFGVERLEAVIMQQAARPAQELAERIVAAAATFGQDGGASDDETLLVIKRLESRPGG
jgi:serine phosphatase RsbU (regulator of sigma subunit)/anti-sigma regulatory factor (Ser/Thr protein kinase)